MTTEEKAKAYEMALEAARKELGVDRKEWEVVQRVLHNIFPELRESEDERIRKELIFFLKEEIPQCSIKEHANKLKEFVSYLEKQKDISQEWKQEDEKMLDSVIRIITQFDDLAHEPTFAGPKWTHPYTKELAWLKSLRPQSKQEATDEEIEEMVSRRSRSTGTTKSEMDFYRNGINDAIKQFGLRPSWKPSEEQMEALNKARRFIPYNCDILESLYEQLKKLGVKEEPEYYQHFDPDC